MRRIAACLLIFGALLSPAWAQSVQIPIAGGKVIGKVDITYAGALRVPDNKGFEYGGAAIAFNPATNSAYLVGHVNYQRVGEVGLNTLISSPTILGLNFATLKQPVVDALEGKLNLVGAGAQIMGQAVYKDRLLINAAIYYDGTGVQSKSLFSRPLALTKAGDVKGPFSIGTTKAGYVSGWLCPIPKVNQLAFGGPLFCGNGAIPVISRTSYGPAAFSFNPDLYTTTPIPYRPFVYYPATNPLGPYNQANPYFTGVTSIKGMVYPDGSSSILYFGRTGETYCYGLGGATNPHNGLAWCYDPTNAAKGEHGYPYRLTCWIYKVTDFLAVQAGTRKPWEIKPSVVLLDTIIPTWASQRAFGGATYDPAKQLVYLTILGVDGPNRNPVIIGLKLKMSP